jgi:hypothetical protein
MTRSWPIGVLAAVMGMMLAAAAIAAGDQERVFNGSMDRVWTVTKSTLVSLGWNIDKEDRDVGWLLTKSRSVEGEEYGVYAKGTKHRLRVVVKGEGASRTLVRIERRLWKEERILFVDKEEELPLRDHAVEKRILEAIAKSL